MKTFECEDGKTVWLCVQGEKDSPLATLPRSGDERTEGELARRILQTFTRTERTSGVTSFMVDLSSNAAAIKRLIESDVFDRLRAREVVTSEDVASVVGQT